MKKPTKEVQLVELTVSDRAYGKIRQNAATVAAPQTGSFLQLPLINAGGNSNVIIGASKFIYTTGASDQGSAFIYHGGPTGLGGTMNPAPTLQLFGSGGNVAYYGWWVTSAGDLNGDGYSDVAVSAYADESGGQTDEGIVYVYRGGASGLSAPSALASPEPSMARFGASLACR